MIKVAVITALNEAETIGALVAVLNQYVDDVIVIDDGSTDNTACEAENNSAMVFRHAERQGIAASLMEAWGKALAIGADYIYQIDAGGSHNPHEICHISPDYDIVIGSRFCGNAQYIGGWRKYFSRVYATLCNWAIGQKVASDWTSGFRIFSRHAAHVLLQEPEYWTGAHAWQAEIIHRAVRKGLTISEVPITYKAGMSTMKPAQLWDAFLVLNKVMFL